MKVILRDDIEKLGKLGEIVDVREGFARNYLLPRRMALESSAGAEHAIDAERKRRLAREAKRSEELKRAADVLNGRSVNIIAKAQEGKIYGSGGADEIV